MYIEKDGVRAYTMSNNATGGNGEKSESCIRKKGKKKYLEMSIRR
jgi:hypothetical protein